MPYTQDQRRGQGEKLKSSVSQSEHYRSYEVVQEAISSIDTPSVAEVWVFEVEGGECTGSSTVDAEVEGSMLLCGDCTELGRSGVGRASS